MNKKGAIEFSMTTIMVVIVGVVVLSLGIAWVMGSFEKIEGLTDTAIESAETALAGPHTGRVNAPSQIILQPGETRKFEIWVVNKEQDASDFSLNSINLVSGSGTGTGGTSGSGCTFTTQKVSTGTLSIEAGDEAKFLGAVFAPKDCSDEDTSVIGIQVHKKSTLYGEESVVAVVQK